MENIKEIIISLINESLGKLNLKYLATLENIETPSNEKFGDLSSNIAMVLTKKLKKNPAEIAREIIKNIPNNRNILKIEFANPGFINFYVNPQLYLKNLDNIEKKGENYGKSKLKTKKRILIDYSAPNIAKTFGIGHLRSTIIGQAIYNLYSAIGWETIGDNHLGDWGTQFGMIIAAIKHDNLDINELSLKDLENLYVNFNKKIASNPKLKDLAREAFSALEKGEKEAVNIWKKAIDISNKEFARIYEILDVKIDYAYGESHYQKIMPEILKLCEGKKISKKSQGAIIIDFEKLPPAMLVKTNGASTYFTRDLATIKFREDTDYLKSDLYVYEVGVPQTTHFNQLFKTVQILNLAPNASFVHVAHGVMRGLGGEKMSTRKGNVIKLDQLIKESKTKAEKLIKNKLGEKLNKEMKENANKIGIGAIKYNELKRSPITDYTFDWNEALSMNGNTSPYIQYTERRARSILKKAKEIKVDTNITMALNEQELKLIKHLYNFNNEIKIATETFAPNKLANYIYELAKEFNTFYNAEKIIGSDKEVLRLKITKSVAQVLKNGLNILGIKTVTKM